MTIDAGRHQLGPENTELAILTSRDGLAAAVGHDLVLEPTRWSANLDVADDGQSATLDADIDLSSLRVVSGSGGALPLSEKDRREILVNATKVLGASATARLEATVAAVGAHTGSPERAHVAGRLTLRGQNRPVAFDVERVDDGSYRGQATVQQTDFGIKPYSAMLGALRIHDVVTVTVRVRA